MFPLDDIQVNDRLNYIERPVAIVEIKMKIMRNKEIHLVKIH